MKNRVIQYTSIVRRSIMLFIVRVIFLELLFEVIYLSWRILIHYVPFSLETLITLNTASIFFFLILITLLQNSILIFLAITWINDYYELRETEVVHSTGIFSKTEKAYPYRDIQSVTIHQGLLGRIFRYGNITLYIPTLGHDLYFNEVTDPVEFAEHIKKAIPHSHTSKFLFPKK